MSKTILIRCDGYKEIGLGHVVRCLVLAKQLRALGHKVLFATQNKNPGFEKIQQENFEIIPIDTLGFNYQLWIENLLSRLSIDIFIGDVRDGLPIEVIEYMKQNQILTVAIDEPSDYAKACDICFYPPHADIDASAYQGKIYQGFEYVILREEFYQPFTKTKNEIPNVLVMMGGTDACNLTLPVLQILETNQQIFTISVVIQPSHPDKDAIKDFINKSHRKIQIFSDIDDMSTFLNSIDFGIITFGMSAYELLIKNIPSIHLCLHKETNYFQDNRYAITSKVNTINLETLFAINFKLQFKKNQITHTILNNTQEKIFNIKTQYAINHARPSAQSIYLNNRLFNTYNKITNKLFGKKLQGTNIDLGSGDKGFTEVCKLNDIISIPYDYPDFDIERDNLAEENISIDFVTMNAVIEHINNPSNILKEIKRVLKDEGLLFIRTPNWQLDFKNFYNDPTHIKPYSPITIKNTLVLAGFDIIFLEPGLVMKSTFWWYLPEKIKWKAASLIKGGTKSILVIGYKINKKENI